MDFVTLIILVALWPNGLNSTNEPIRTNTTKTEIMKSLERSKKTFEEEVAKLDLKFPGLF